MTPASSCCDNADTATIPFPPRLLEFDPARRLSAPAALAHPFIARMSACTSPPVCTPMCIAPEEFDFETRKLTIDDLRAEVAYESE